MGRQKQSKTPPTFGQPAKPTNLSPSAALEWDRLIGEIAASGLQITPAHRALIALAATLAADIKFDWAELQDNQYQTTDKGLIVAHPALKRMDALRRDLIKTLSAIGLRPGLSTEPEGDDSLAEMLKG